MRVIMQTRRSQERGPRGGPMFPRSPDGSGDGATESGTGAPGDPGDPRAALEARVAALEAELAGEKTEVVDKAAAEIAARRVAAKAVAELAASKAQVASRKAEVAEAERLLALYCGSSSSTKAAARTSPRRLERTKRRRETQEREAEATTRRGRPSHQAEVAEQLPTTRGAGEEEEVNVLVVELEKAEPGAEEEDSSEEVQIRSLEFWTGAEAGPSLRAARAKRRRVRREREAVAAERNRRRRHGEIEMIFADYVGTKFSVTCASTTSMTKVLSAIEQQHVWLNGQAPPYHVGEGELPYHVLLDGVQLTHRVSRQSEETLADLDINDQDWLDIMPRH